MDHLLGLLSDQGFMPHGHCYLWIPSLVALEVSTNLAIGLAYVVISFTLARLVMRIRDLPFRWLYIAFGVFIISCGLTHFLDVWVIWYPSYWTDAAVRVVTAIASVGTALLLPPLVPQAEALARGAKAAQDRGIRLMGAVHDLERMYQRATELDELKTRFFANVSHELRTPLALVLGPIERLDRMELPAEARTEIDVARRNARLLLALVDDLLDLAKLEAGEAELRPARLDLAELVRSTAANFDALAIERETDYVVESPDELLAVVDPDRIRRAVLNLVSNAFKFTPPGGRVRVALTRAGDRAQIRVEDSGPGIPAASRELVFERFRQLEVGAGRRYGGTGLGLAITREFVELHGGTVTVGDAPGGGAAFLVEVPLARREASERSEAPPRPEPAVARAIAGLAPEPPTEPDAPAGDRPVALVVEDNADMRRFVARVLEPDYAVITAADGADGARKAIEHHPDIVVTDLAMPGASGEVLVDEVRRHPELDATPIVLVTARSDEQLRIELLRRGAQDWIAKPFEPAELRARVDNLAKVARVRRFLQQQLDSRSTDLEALARDLEATRRLAERSSELKSTFLRAVSHELRSPLHALGLAVELLERRPDERERLLAAIRDSVDRLKSLVEGILQRARLEGPVVRLALAPIALDELAREVLLEHAPHAGQKGVALELTAEPGRPPLISDRDLVRVVLTNLIGNAVKFTDAGRIEVSVESDGERWRVDVLDTGPGLGDLDPDTLFEPFASERTGGTGLGLSLVRELTRALGGEVGVDSGPGGTRFRVELPSLGSERIRSR